MEHAVADFNSASRVITDYASRLNTISSALSIESSFSDIRGSIRSRANVLNDAASAIVKTGKCFENIRLEYINCERATYQKLELTPLIKFGVYAPNAAARAINVSLKFKELLTPLRKIIKPRFFIGKVILPAVYPVIRWDDVRIIDVVILNDPERYNRHRFLDKLKG